MNVVAFVGIHKHCFVCDDRAHNSVVPSSKIPGGGLVSCPAERVGSGDETRGGSGEYHEYNFEHWGTD